MSAYGDYKCGAITYREYCAIMDEEERMNRDDAMPRPMICDYCAHYGDVCRNIASGYYGHLVSADDTCEEWDESGS